VSPPGAPSLDRVPSRRGVSGVALGLAIGTLVDAAVGDPRRFHPVAIFGGAAATLERWVYRPSRAAGACHLLGCLAAVGAPAFAARRLARHRPLLDVGLTALGTWTVLGGRSLSGAAAVVADAVSREDLPAARAGLPNLCGRDPSRLDGPGLVRATVESVAENTSDAVVAPLFWGMVGGLPGLLLYRAVNTLDAMVGHRSPRYADFGTPAARLDDVANWLPARLTAALALLLAPLVEGSRAGALRAWRGDAANHPSPNAGAVEAAFAGALGVRLGGPVVYAYGEQERPVLGDGRPVVPADVGRAVRLSRAVTAAALATCVAVRWVR
jgi:adenosylcobinamide-phosphate synthase